MAKTVKKTKEVESILLTALNLCALRIVRKSSTACVN